ncbi:MAG: 23S rRNA (uracil(1939)-C(5))-methyltransferase RlmD [Bacteroidaceae bacterium]|nr:23S rRNA (uracil(1939)-C(5))-methyltransferase RlmD [Bacteroidaceae bacterium]
MSRKRKQLPLLEAVEITDVAAEGKSLVRINDLVVFVPFVIPGDVVDLQLTRKKHSYAEAEVVRMVKPSADRVAPFCQHFGVCGGCKWQMLPYELQLAAKQKQVMDALTRIGKVELPACTPILGSQKTQEYRNKLEFGFCNRRWLTKEQIASGEQFERQESVGYHANGTFDKILPIEECHLMDPINDRLRLAIRDYAYQHDLTFFDAREHTGLLRGMMIRLSNTGELMLLIQFCIPSEEEQQQAEALLTHIDDQFPEITSLLYVNNQKFNDTFGDLPVHVFRGEDHIFLEMEGLRFKVGAKSFYQTNTEQAYELYKVAREFAFENSQCTIHNSQCTKPLVYDLYTGTGTIANFVARQARQVIGIEYVPEAIEDAKVNSALNGITNTQFFAGDMKDILTEDFIRHHGRPDIIITDPPRAGMHADVIKVILSAAPQRIVYVSCNPATQARDLQLLDVDYQVTRIQPVDMFPHTQHVENVVLLERRKKQDS